MIGETIVVTDNRGFSLVYIILLLGIAAALAAMLVKLYRQYNAPTSSEGNAVSQYGVRTVSDESLDDLKF